LRAKAIFGKKSAATPVLRRAGIDFASFDVWIKYRAATARRRRLDFSSVYRAGRSFSNAKRDFLGNFFIFCGFLRRRRGNGGV